MTSLSDRWEEQDEMASEDKHTVLAEPRWKRDNLKGYGGDTAQPTQDTVDQKPEK